MLFPEMNQVADSPETLDSDEWISVGQYPTLSEAFEYSLVILAMGEACRVEPAETGDHFQLQAEPQPLPVIQRELTAYEQEAAYMRAKRNSVESPHYPYAIRSIALWIILLYGAFYWQGLHPEIENRLASSSLGLWRDGEWWRPFTSLLLHADIPHLTGNVFYGSILLYFLVRSMGAARAWFWILLTASVANALNSWLHYPEYFQAIGASTAIFSALGLLAGQGVAEYTRIRPRLPWAKIATPFCAGLILLGMLGSSHDPQIDVMAHISGFATGLIAGISVGMLETNLIEDDCSSASA